MVDSLGADIRACGALGCGTWRPIGLFVTTGIVVHHMNAFVDEFMKGSFGKTVMVSVCADAREQVDLLHCE